MKTGNGRHLLYVIDASVAGKWFLPETYSDRARDLLDRFIARELVLLAPDVLIAEVGNTLWKRAMRGDISVDDARQSYLDFLNLHISLEASAAVAERAWELSARTHHPLYDTLYLALAEAHQCEFVTADRALIAKLGPKFRLIRWLGNL